MSPMLKKHILFLYTVTGCDRRMAVTIIKNSVLHLVINTPANIADTGEKSLLGFCEATKNAAESSKHGIITSNEQCLKNSLCAHIISC